MKLIDANKLIEKLSANLDNPEEFPVISLGTVMRMIDGEEEIHISEPEAPCYLGSPCEYQNPNAEIPEERTEKRTETHACDLISRQAAIRWIKTECNPYGKPTLDFESGKRVMKHLEQMPPAQPERTCVNCGRTANNGGWYADGGTRCPIEEHYALPKDGYCHLWEKRNVTDDDYPERREK